MTHLTRSSNGQIPNIYSTCKQFGVDITAEPIPGRACAHYMCGGIKTDEYGETNINHSLSRRSAFTGLHGANRLASNSLLEALVFAPQDIQKTAAEIKNLRR